MSFREIEGKKLILNWHEGQKKMMASEARIVAVLCGSQWGKTEGGVHWFHREIERCGAGDYLIGTATFKLQENKLIPDFLYVFKDLLGLGDFQSSKGVFLVSKRGEMKLWGKEQEKPTRILVFSGQSPSGAEAATAKAAWLDEVGQEEFKEQTFEAIERRLRIHRGRILLTTTLYNFGWLKRRIYDPWLNGDPLIDVIQGDSIDNPLFPKDEWERAQQSMPSWKFDLFYRGRFTRPAGMVYDCFDTSKHCLKRFDIPKEWPVYVGHDFGPANMAAIWLAQNPGTGDFYLYKSYKGGSKSVGEHTEEFRKMSVGENIIKRVGGAPRIEDGWREAFTLQGWPILSPKVKKPEQQILRVYELIKRNKFFVFDDLTEVITDIVGLAYKLDDQNLPTDKLENDVSSHYCAALRYIGSDFSPETVEKKEFTRVIAHQRR